MKGHAKSWCSTLVSSLFLFCQLICFIHTLILNKFFQFPCRTCFIIYNHCCLSGLPWCAHMCVCVCVCVCVRERELVPVWGGISKGFKKQMIVFCRQISSPGGTLV